MLDLINLIILVGGGLVLLSVFTSLLSTRAGVPLLLVFLSLGLLAGEDGIGGINFDNAPLAYFIGSVALAIILFDSGFSTRFQSFRVAAWPSLTLATVGVLLTTGLMGLFAHAVLGMPWLEAFLIGAIVSSTDAAAVFLLLRVGGITIRDRVRSTLEIESGSNDPMAIFLTIALVEQLASGERSWSWELLGNFGVQAVVGGLGGAAAGWLMVKIINRVRLEDGLYPVAVLAMAIVTFGIVAALGGSGFLAVYVAGLVAGNTRMRAAPVVHRFQTGMTWLGQIMMFLTLGLLASPSSFGEVMVPALLLSTFLILIARPLAIWLCLLPFNFSRNETAFVAWVGLRGAVSILLAIVPILGGLPGGQAIFNMAFIIVLTSLIVQGWTISPMARWLGLVLPRKIGPVDRVELALPGEVNMELVAYTIHPESPVARGQRLPRWARPALILRDGRPIDIRTARGLSGGDHIYLFSSPRRISLLDRLFAATAELGAEDRDFFGDFAIKGDVTYDAVAQLYGLAPIPDLDGVALAAMFRRDFGNAVEVGDRLRLGGVELVVREAEEGEATMVGLVLEPQGTGQPRLPVFQTRRELVTTARRMLRRLRGKDQPETSQTPAPPPSRPPEPEPQPAGEDEDEQAEREKAVG
ncbi:MAG TPA: potassium/proton antiporter [Alphaproteobacteria bacterium]|nr:potassium/proton antiporter [Alphaproteobacteria bacterium]